MPLQYAIDMAIILEQSHLTQPIPLKLQVGTVRRYHNYFDQMKGVSNVSTNSEFYLHLKVLHLVAIEGLLKGSSIRSSQPKFLPNPVNNHISYFWHLTSLAYF